MKCIEIYECKKETQPRIYFMKVIGRQNDLDDV